MMNMKARPVPTEAQLAWQRDRPFALFCHFGINTFYGREWSDGTLDPARFAPNALDCRQWVTIAKDAGAAHIILTAKHHDGFCLWPTATTNYSVRSSPWREGEGDVVQELADACREAGLGLGLYLSPWDRHDPDWERRPAVYDARYIAQLTELCTRYGPLVELWFDGAGSERRAYAWDDIMAVARRHQPDAMIFNMGDPTIRWIGNEDGLATDPCRYTVGEVDTSIYDERPADLAGGERYLPPECDVPVRRYWFWQPDDLQTLKSVNHLLAIWYRSIGLGANLLLNVPPDRRGLIDGRDAARLLAFTGTIRDRFAHPVVASLAQEGGRIVATFNDAVTFDHLVLREHLETGQWIDRHRVLDGRSGLVLVDSVGTVGSQRVHVFSRVTTDRLMIEVERPEGRLDSLEAHLTGVETVPALEAQAPVLAGKMDSPE